MAYLRVNAAPVKFEFKTSQAEVTLTKTRPSWWDRMKRSPWLARFGGSLVVKLLTELIEWGWEWGQQFLRVKTSAALRSRT